eukprot:gene43839-54475_t
MSPRFTGAQHSAREESSRMRSKPLALTLIVIALAGAGWWWKGRSTSDGAAAAASAPASGVQAEAGALGFADVFASPDLASLIRRHVQGGKSFQAELELNTVDGIRWHSIDARPMRDPVSGDPVLQFNARDINDFRLAQQALTVLLLGGVDAQRSQDLLTHFQQREVGNLQLYRAFF